MEQKIILVVDDEENTRKLLSFALEKAGYSVLSAKNGLEAIEILKKCVPDTIVLDIVMPDMDGYSFVKEIKKMPVVQNIPIVISSGKGGMKEYFELEDPNCHPDAFLIKPYKMSDLVNTVNEILKDK